MKIPYSFTFPEKESKKMLIGKLPDWSTYRLFFAQEKWLYIWQSTYIISQQLSNPPFYIDLVEINTNDDVSIPFVVNSRQLLLYFMLDGSISFSTPEGMSSEMSKQHSFFIAIWDEGNYYLHVTKGKNTSLVICILPEWIAAISQNLPYLQKILKMFKYDEIPYKLMYQCKTDKQVMRWLDQIFRSTINNIGVLDGNLRKYISYILEFYDSKIGVDEDSLAHRVKVYIEAHYSEADLNVKFLADYFAVTERTLLNHFKRAYHTSVQIFYTHLRMRKALQLESEGFRIKDIYSNVGYLDERTFRTAFKKYKTKIYGI